MSIVQNIIDDLKIQEIQLDKEQIDTLDELNKVFYKENIFEIISKGKSKIKGFYLWGDVGRGKTLLISNFLKFKNIHFLEYHYIDFMNFIHDQFNIFSGEKNPINKIHAVIRKKSDVLFIDEFQVEDVADAMIIGTLVNQLINSDMKIFITSNAHPSELYKDGLQRAKFIQSMINFQKHTIVFELTGKIDYRSKKIGMINTSEKTIFKDKDIVKIIEDYSSKNSNFGSHVQLGTRKFKCKGFNNSLIWIDFKEFFGMPTGAKDYKKMCENFKWIFVNNFFICGDDEIDIIRRFISFIDICYKEKMKIKFFFNETHFESLYKGSKIQNLWVRCLSRLKEIQSENYLNEN